MCSPAFQYAQSCIFENSEGGNFPLLYACMPVRFFSLGRGDMQYNLEAGPRYGPARKVRLLNTEIGDIPHLMGIQDTLMDISGPEDLSQWEDVE